LGGAYLSWKEGAGLYVTRLDPTGAVAAGWPARGRSVGAVSADSPRPSFIEDGQHGIYLGWVTYSMNPIALAVHLGPANTGAGGWPNSARVLSVDPTFTTPYWPQLALASDGGLFASYAVSSPDEGLAPSTWRLRRLTSAGLTAPGWAAEGVTFGSFQRGLLGSPVAGSLLALGPDGSGGVYVVIGNPGGSDPSYGGIL